MTLIHLHTLLAPYVVPPLVALAGLVCLIVLTVCLDVWVAERIGLGDALRDAAGECPDCGEEVVRCRCGGGEG